MRINAGVELGPSIPFDQVLKQEKIWSERGINPDHLNSLKGYMGGWYFPGDDKGFKDPIRFLTGAGEEVWEKRASLIDIAIQTPIPDPSAADPFDAAYQLIQFVKGSLPNSSADTKEAVLAHQHDKAVLDVASYTLAQNLRDLTVKMVKALLKQPHPYQSETPLVNITHNTGKFFSRESISGFGLSPESIVLVMRALGIAESNPQKELAKAFRPSFFSIHPEKGETIPLVETKFPGLKVAAGTLFLGGLTGREVHGDEIGGSGLVSWTERYLLSFVIDEKDVANLLLERLLGKNQNQLDPSNTPDFLPLASRQLPPQNKPLDFFPLENK